MGEKGQIFHIEFQIMYVDTPSPSSCHLIMFLIPFKDLDLVFYLPFRQSICHPHQVKGTGERARDQT